MAPGCQARRRSDPLTFTEWPIVPRLPPFEKFKSARIHRGDAGACGFAPFPICLQASPPSPLPACPPPAEASSSHGSVCAAGRNFVLAQAGYPAWRKESKPAGEDPPALRAFSTPLLGFTRSICSPGFGQLAGWKRWQTHLV